MKKHHNQSAFTIVELLIVIVVIAILAAISAVIYTGIRERAVAANYTSAINQWGKLMQAELATSGTLPSTNVSYACLGRSASDFPARDGFGAGECFRWPDGSTASFNEDFIDELEFKDSLPSGLLPVARMNHNGNIYLSRGVPLIHVPAQRQYWVIWISQMAGQCLAGNEIAGAEPGALEGGMCHLLINY